jgi:hypothetical protein
MKMERKQMARSIQLTVIGGLSLLAFGCGQNKEQAAPVPVAKAEQQPNAATTAPISAPVTKASATTKPTNSSKPDSKDKKSTAAKKPSSDASTSAAISFLPEEPTASKPAVMGAEGIASGESMFGRANREMEDREAAAQAQLDRENSLRSMMNQNVGGYKVRSSK